MLLTEIKVLIREAILDYNQDPNPECAFKYYVPGIADQIIDKILESVDGADIDNPAWHKNDREYEAYCAGKNDKLQAIKKLFEGEK